MTKAEGERRKAEVAVEPYPQLLRSGAFDCQLCVPADWDDARVVQFAEIAYPAGTELGWHIRREGDKALCGARERVPCDSRAGFVHIMLDL